MIASLWKDNWFQGVFLKENKQTRIFYTKLKTPNNFISDAFQ